MRKKYSEGYYEYLVNQSKWIRDKQIQYTGNVTEANEAHYRVMLGHQINYAKASEDIQKGSKAALKQRELDQETEGQKAFSRMQTLMSSVQGNIKGTISGSFKAEFTSIGDIILDMGTKFRNTLADMAADAASAQLMESLFNTDSAQGASNWFLKLLSGGSKAPAKPDNWVSYGHTGGVAGPGGFQQLPRFHTGLKSDEFPAVLQRGEAVIPKNKVGSLGGGNVTVNVHPPPGQTPKVKENTSVGGDRDLEIYFANSVTRGGPMSTAMEQTYGVKRLGRRA